MKKRLLIVTGCTAVGLGFAGAFLPLLPTTPFLLLAAWCFARSSPRLDAWLLANRFCGPYIRDYRAGSGVPPQVKAASILMLWGGITFSAVFFVDPVWAKTLLYLIAIAVSLHILSIRPQGGTIHILVPTEMEIAPFRALCVAGVRIAVTGIGTTNALCVLQNLLRNGKPRLIILCGVAGTYPGSGLEVGDCVAVGEERTADMGSFAGPVFSEKFVQSYRCPEPPKGLPTVVSNTVNAAGASYVKCDGVQIENMEGAAFFAGCLGAGIPFWEIRAISNMVGEPFENWNLPLATERLASTLKEQIDALNA